MASNDSNAFDLPVFEEVNQEVSDKFRDKESILYDSSDEYKLESNSFDTSESVCYSSYEDESDDKNVKLESLNTSRARKSSRRSKNNKIVWWLKFLFRHPASRLLLVFSVFILNIVVYAEDPISYSEQEADIYGLGRIYNYLFRQYPSTNDGGWICWKVISLLFWIIMGLFTGKYIVHDIILRDCLRITLFRHHRGSWFVMMFTTMFTIYCGSFLYNAVVYKFYYALPGHRNDRSLEYILNDKLGFTDVVFGKIAASLTLFSDYLTIFMVLDTMVQISTSATNVHNDKWGNYYGNFFKFCCRKGSKGWSCVRIPLFWILSIFMTMIIALIALTDYAYAWTTYKKGFFGTTEVTRCYLSGILVSLDIMVFMQDWDFPAFKNADTNVKIVGCKGYELVFKSKCRLGVTFTSKWINYGALILVICADTNMFISQLSYVPEDYGQITDVNDYVRLLFNPIETNNDTNDQSHGKHNIDPGSLWQDEKYVWSSNNTYAMHDINNYDDTSYTYTSFFYHYTTICKTGFEKEDKRLVDAAYKSRERHNVTLSPYNSSFNDSYYDITSNKTVDTLPMLKIHPLSCYNVSEPMNIRYTSNDSLAKYGSVVIVVIVYLTLLIFTCYRPFINKHACSSSIVCKDRCRINEDEYEEDDRNYCMCCPCLKCCDDNDEDSYWGASQSYAVI